jgi:hypothetical protein
MDWEFIIELNHKTLRWKKTNGIDLMLDEQQQQQQQHELRSLLSLLLFHKIGNLQPIHMDWDFFIEMNHKTIRWEKTNGIDLTLDVQPQHLQQQLLLEELQFLNLASLPQDR